MSDVLKKLTREMEKVQEPKRFVHTQGVEYTAAALAMRYGEDVEPVSYTHLTLPTN